MRILVTGGAGMIGSHCAEFYARLGWDVVVLDNLRRSRIFGSGEPSVENNWRYLSDFDNVTKIKGDVRNESDLRSALGDGVDAVIHAAAQPGVPSSVRLPGEDFLINAYGTLNVLESVRRVSPRAAFVYCSTNKVYGENVDRIPLRESARRYDFEGVSGIDESMPIDRTGHTPYGASKYVGDLYCQEYARTYGMKTGIFRLSCVYGTRQYGFADQGWVSWFVSAFLRRLPISIFGDGKQVRDLLYVGDAVRAFDSFIRGGLKHEVCNLGGGPENNLSLLEFLDVLETRMGPRPQVKFTHWRPSDQKVYITDNSRAGARLGWRPEMSVMQGVGELIDWSRKNIRVEAGV